MVKGPDRFFLAGITSFGVEATDFPGIYTYVPKFVEWIDSIINGTSL
jgi:secreted trypsin-like serine protease